MLCIVLIVLLSIQLLFNLYNKVNRGNQSTKHIAFIGIFFDCVMYCTFYCEYSKPYYYKATPNKNKHL